MKLFSRIFPLTIVVTTLFIGQPIFSAQALMSQPSKPPATSSEIASPNISSSANPSPVAASSVKTSSAIASSGYIMTTAKGAVLSYGNVPLFGSLGTANLDAPIVAIAATNDGQGYWLAGADGGVFTFGDAPFYGSMHGQLLTAPITGVAGTPDTKGYWLVAADGGIFSFGDAGFYGSMGGIKLDKPVQALVPTFDGKGYWEVASDGGIFSFGDAPFYGSMGTKPLNAPIVGLAPSQNGQGYWEVATDGGIFAFGNAQFYGSMGGQPLVSSIVGIASTLDGQGYWMAGADGGIFNYGDAPFRGSNGQADDLFYPVVSFAYAPGSGSGIDNGQSEGLDRYVSGSEGYDISWPQCPSNFPPHGTVDVVGINDGHGMSINPCFLSEAQWAGVNLSIYMNADFFAPQSSPPASAMSGPAGNCSQSDLNCQGYNYGWASAQYSVAGAQKVGIFSNLWWLDVEQGNSWSNSTSANSQAIQGMIDYLHSQSIVVGIYSTAYQWGNITGGFQPTVPNWYASGSSGDPPFDCNQGFTGGPTWLVQAAWTGSNSNFDADYAC